MAYTVEEKQNILSEGLRSGVAFTCGRHEISRTTYYNWMKKFEENGVKGLKRSQPLLYVKRKRDENIDRECLRLMKRFPSFGPNSLSSMLKEKGVELSGSSIYLLMKELGLTKKEDRMAFDLSALDNPVEAEIFRVKEAAMGEVWICWTNFLGQVENHGPIFQMNILDVHSKVACSRLYSSATAENAIDLFLGVGYAMGKQIHMSPTMIYTEKALEYTGSKGYQETEFKAMLKKLDLSHRIYTEDEMELGHIIKVYNQVSIKEVKRLLHEYKDSFQTLKRVYQNFIREYNSEFRDLYPDHLTPLERVRGAISSEIELPLWAYVNREY